MPQASAATVPPSNRDRVTPRGAISPSHFFFSHFPSIIPPSAGAATPFVVHHSHTKSDTQTRRRTTAPRTPALSHPDDAEGGDKFDSDTNHCKKKKKKKKKKGIAHAPELNQGRRFRRGHGRGGGAHLCLLRVPWHGRRGKPCVCWDLGLQLVLLWSCGRSQDSESATANPKTE